ncbi:MAG: hypothetical protein KA384_09000 [Leptotrichiaceae bacterium]|nr:hypothetical protein [Leptotrichiaceae bacterium]
MFNKDQVKNLIESNGFISKEEEIIEVINYLSKQEFNTLVLKNLIDRKIEYEKLYYKDKIMDLDTLSLISFFSLAKVEKFDITPIEKTMKIFDKIKKIFLIGTRESISSAKQYKNKLEEKFRNISVKIFEIETGDYEEVYNLLRVIIGENLLEKSNILIDNTLGNKMTGAVFYRFGVEQGVKLITWQNEQIKNIDDFALRIPGTEKFNFVKEPEFFNYNTYRNIDYLLEKYKFEEAKMLFEQMNNYDMVLICKAFSKIYCYETLSSIYGIFDEIDEFIKVTSGIEDMSINKKIRKYNFIFSLLLSNDTKSKNLIDNLEDISWNNLTDYQIKKNVFSLTEVQKKEFIALLTIEYFLTAFPYELSCSFIENILEDDFPMVRDDDFRSQILSFENAENSLEEISNFLGIANSIVDLFLKYNDTFIFKPNEDFKRNLSDKITINSGFITIPFLNINELQIKKLENKFKSRNSIIIYELLESENYYMSSKKIIEIFTENGKEIKENQRISKYYGDLKRFLKECNEQLKIEATKKGKNISDFFLLEKENNKSYKAIKINKNF